MNYVESEILENFVKKCGKKIIFFDLETTGLDVDNDRIIQIAALKLEFDSKIDSFKQSKLDMMYNPDYPVSPEAAAVHGFTNEMLTKYRTFREDIPYLLTFFDFGNSILAGFNQVNFDVPLLINEFKRNSLLPDFECKYIDVRNIFVKKEERTLEGAYRFYCNCKFENAHDAYADTFATVEVFEKQLSVYSDLNEMSPEEIHDFCGFGGMVDFAGKLKKAEDGSIVYNFGKYAGKKVLDYPDYAAWMLTNNFPRDTKDHLHKLLNKNKLF